MLLVISSVNKLLGYFMKKSYDRQGKKNSGLKKNSREKAYDNLFNSLVDMKDIV